jgi:uncharacterized membrane protein YbjE (DUF340 family)
MIKYVITALALGAAAGYMNNNFLNAVPNALVSDQLFNLSLIVLLFVFGFSFGLDKEAMDKMKKTGPRILAFPLFVVLGSLLGGLVGGLILRIDVAGAMAVSAGFGWLHALWTIDWAVVRNAAGNLGICRKLPQGAANDNRDSFDGQA